MCFQFCWEAGGYLAELLSSEEEARLNAILAKDIDYWIGLTDLAHEGVWMWQERRTEADIFNWAPRQPNNGNALAHEDCVVKRKTDGLWNDRPCDNDVPHALCRAPERQL